MLNNMNKPNKMVSYLAKSDSNFYNLRVIIMANLQNELAQVQHISGELHQCPRQNRYGSGTF